MEAEIAGKFAEDAETFATYSEGFDTGKRRGAIIAIRLDHVVEMSGLNVVRWDGVSAEYERRSLGPVPNVSRGLLGIHVSPTDLDVYLAMVDDLPGDIVEILKDLRSKSSSASVVDGDGVWLSCAPEFQPPTVVANTFGH